ncbi:MAG: response regulator [Dehalococcoidia bacterium]|nr:response regulator [Dehalococcoidia bacterium]
METEPIVLAVDDEKTILNVISTELKLQGFRVLTAQSAEEAINLADEYRPDIAVLDLMMPDVGGYELMRHLRERRPLPVILLTAMGAATDKVRGLELGADDYVAKPFDPQELGARVRAVLRRTSNDAPEKDNVVVADEGRVEINLEKRTVRRQGELVNLSRTEWLLLQYLAANAGKVMLNNQVLSAVWGPEYRDEFQYLRVWVFRLRQKLEESPASPKIIKTRPGIGLMLCSDDVAEAAREKEASLSASK